VLLFGEREKGSMEVGKYGGREVWRYGGSSIMLQKMGLEGEACYYP